MGLFLQSTSGLDVLGREKNERLELVKNLGSENKQNVTTVRLVFYPGGPYWLVPSLVLSQVDNNFKIHQ